MNELSCDVDRLCPNFRIQSLVAIPDAEHATNAVVETKLEKGRPDHVVQSGAQTTTGHQSRGRVLRIEEDALARARLFERELLLLDLRPDLIFEAHPRRIRDEMRHTPELPR